MTLSLSLLSHLEKKKEEKKARTKDGMLRYTEGETH